MFGSVRASLLNKRTVYSIQPISTRSYYRLFSCTRAIQSDSLTAIAVPIHRKSAAAYSTNTTAESTKGSAAIDNNSDVKHSHTGAAIDDPTEHDQDFIAAIPTGPMENPNYHKGTVWFDNIFPFHLGLLDPRTYWVKYYSKRFILHQRWSRLIPPWFPSGAEFQFREAEPNLKEGGLYLKFKYKGGTIEEAIEAIQAHVHSTGIRSIFNFGRINAFEVKGRPWVEDMVFRIPSRRLHVEFHGPDLSVEQLYREFRSFGRIMDITIQPSSIKDLPRFASVEFVNKRSATSARNCIHGELIDGTRVHIGYEKVKSSFSFWNWAISNLRISIPILLAVTAALSYIVFDPLRVFSIVSKLTDRFSFEKYTETAGAMWNGAQSSISALISATGYSSMDRSKIKNVRSTNQGWDERETEAKRLELHYKQAPETLVIVHGPKGSGKSELVRKSLEHHKKKLFIHCEDLVGQPEYVLITRLASQVNFFPSFGFMSQITTFMDAIITATTGAKAGLGTTKETEIRKILDCVTKAVTDLTLDQREARQKVLDELVDKSDEYNHSLSVPEIEYPVIVIDGFLGKENARGHFLYDMMAEWAAVTATQYKVAHVIFISDNPAAVREIGKVIPTKSVETFILNDATPETALAYVHRRLPELDTKSLWPSIEPLGGRLHDLDLLIQKIHAGLTPTDAFDDILHRSVTELRKIGLNEEADKSKHEWNDVQFWKIVQMLSKFDEVPFDHLVMHPIFKGDTQALSQMERNGLITLIHSHGRPYTIRPGKPIYRSAFTLMTQDTRLVSTMGILTAKQLISDEEKKVRVMEEEMCQLGLLQAHDGISTASFWTGGSNHIQSRMDYLASKLGDSAKKISNWNNEEARYRKELKLIE
ncbi:mitochondrial escape protein 2 [Batrachochytrium dendrobatidis]|nr:mitochondrial escape protein 2 [Batrachochytrium dendrobatidis]